MVSFQCNGCGDVLTKPKLDKHRAMCNSSFDCIDCSKRFESSADYKGHTSCISEAEKYQKTLYNGGGGSERNGRNQRSRQLGGGRQWGDNQSQWQQRNVNKATGANDTPLGTPIRMSPVNDTPVVDGDTQKSQPVAETPKKRKAEAEIVESKDTSEPTKKKKKQRNADNAQETTEANVANVRSPKKRESTSGVTITKGPSPDPNHQPVEDGDAMGEVSGKKKNKKEKKAKGTREDEKEESKKEKRKKKADPSSSGDEPESGAMTDIKVAVTVRPPVTEVTPAIATEEARSTKKKYKSKEAKLKPKVVATDEALGVPAPAQPPQPTASEVAEAQDDQADRKKRKKRQSGNHREDDGGGKRVAEMNGGNLKETRKEKKRKRKPDGQAVSGVE